MDAGLAGDYGLSFVPSSPNFDNGYLEPPSPTFNTESLLLSTKEYKKPSFTNYPKLASIRTSLEKESFQMMEPGFSRFVQQQPSTSSQT
jgi:hypothetical protein